jgi:hypothetical protein
MKAVQGSSWRVGEGLYVLRTFLVGNVALTILMSKRLVWLLTKD